MMTKLRRTLSLLAAAAMLFGAGCPPAAANSDGITVQVDQVILTLSELQEMNYTVPVYVRLTDNVGINAFEFGITTDERCTYEIVIASKKAQELGGEPLDFMPAGKKVDIAWFAWANGEVETYTGNLALIMVTLPEDAQPGDVFNVDYVEYYSQGHVWYDSISKTDFVKNGTVDYANGCIQLASEGTAPLVGDVDLNGKVEILDAILLSKSIMGAGNLSIDQIMQADCDGDSFITSMDALALMKYLVKLVDALPIS